LHHEERRVMAHVGAQIERFDEQEQSRYRSEKRAHINGASKRRKI
jgi:hypothetical protein